MDIPANIKKTLAEGHTIYHFEPHAPGLQFTKIGDIIFSTELIDTENRRYGNEYNYQPSRFAED